MSKADITSQVVRVEDETIWQQVMDDSETKLVIINAHPSWCGPCEAIVPTMTRVLLDYEKADQRFMYCTGNIGKIGSFMQKSITAAMPTMDLEKAGCLPLFAVYKAKVCLAVVVGVDSPTLLQHVSTHMPAIPS
jgi:thioredoxin 1